MTKQGHPCKVEYDLEASRVCQAGGKKQEGGGGDLCTEKGDRGVLCAGK